MNKRIKAVLTDVKSYVFTNKLKIIYSSALLIGILLGALFIANKYQYGFFEAVCLNFIEARGNHNFAVVSSNSFSSSFLFLLYVYLSGYFSFGFISSYIMLFIRGIGIGLISGYIYSTYALKGVAFFIINLLPNLFITSLVLISAGVISSKFSFCFYSLLLNKQSLFDFGTKSKKYSLKFIVYLGLLILSSCLDGITKIVFWNVFF